MSVRPFLTFILSIEMLIHLFHPLNISFMQTFIRLLILPFKLSITNIKDIFLNDYPWIFYAVAPEVGVPLNWAIDVLPTEMKKIMVQCFQVNLNI